MNSSCQHVLCGLMDFSKKLPDNVVKVKKGMAFFVERSALYSLSILKLLFFVSVNCGAKKIFFCFLVAQKNKFEISSVYEVDLLEVNFTEIENRLFSLYEEHVLVGEVGRIVAFSDMVSWVLYEEVLEEIRVLVMLDETRSVYSNFDFGEFVSREFMMEQADLGLYRKEYVDKLISNY
ncbi:hypothetical protein [Pseudomonas aeruginosa]|uniref:hypothetical protein n=1 Tax=Pseudomonas aeruginosa TaxID=287 RepID=UPI0019117FCB|nr:hypothetical protein [Pseudomonas aeruginosa]WCW19625.1 hypothetical protein KK183_00235 [Pseudomonas aeruginosa]